MALENDRRALLARLSAIKAKSLRLKQTINWKTVETVWDDYFEDPAHENWREEFMPVIQALIVDQGETWNAEFGMAFDVRDLFGEAWFDTYMLVFAQEINQTTKDDIAKLLQQAMENGWTVDQMVKQLDTTWARYLKEGVDGRELTDEERQWFEERAPRFRREMIARTETIRASNAGSVALFESWGVVEKKEWLATLDNRTRGSHLRAMSNYSEGGTPGPIGLNQSFKVGGSSLLFPADPSGSPGETINCRCTVLPFFDEFPSSQAEIDVAQGAIDSELERRRFADVPTGQAGKFDFLPSEGQKVRAENAAWAEIENIARATGISPEEVASRVEAELAKIIKRPISVRSSLRSALGIAESGRFKTQFETGTSGGEFQPDRRKDAESLGLGYDWDSDPTRRPIYGYLPTSNNNAHIYGQVEFVLADSVKRRSTITLGDSMAPFRQSQAVGTPLSKPTQAGWDARVDLLYRKGESGISDYVEVQVQGGVSTKDVKKIIVHVRRKDPARRSRFDEIREQQEEEMIAELRAQGFKVEVSVNTK